jgi:hypothetical protein
MQAASGAIAGHRVRGNGLRLRVPQSPGGDGELSLSVTGVGQEDRSCARLERQRAVLWAERDLHPVSRDRRPLALR